MLLAVVQVGGGDVVRVRVGVGRPEAWGGPGARLVFGLGAGAGGRPNDDVVARCSNLLWRLIGWALISIWLTNKIDDNNQSKALVISSGGCGDGGSGGDF